MASLIIIIFALTMRLLMHLVKKPSWVIEVFRYSGAILPLTFIILEILENDGISLVFAGICFFWFPMVSKSKKSGS